MDKHDVKLLEQIWSRHVGKPFSLQELARQVRHDGGHDMSGLSGADLVSLLEGEFSGDWKEIKFAFEETLAYYSVDEMSDEQMVGWAFTILAIADAIDRGVADVELSFNSFINSFWLVREKLTVEESVYIFQRFFHGDRRTPAELDL